MTWFDWTQGWIKWLRKKEEDNEKNDSTLAARCDALELRVTTLEKTLGKLVGVTSELKQHTDPVKQALETQKL